MSNSAEFKISKSFKNSHWNSLLDSNGNVTNWDHAAEIVGDRFESRMLCHLGVLKDDGWSGFVIMSICCLLVETLMQFYLGKNYTSDHDRYDRSLGPDIGGVRRNQKRAFVDFLMNSPNFNTCFDTEQKCAIFYDHFRNGLLHQAQTKYKSKIKICRFSMVELVDPNNVSSGLIIDRNIFLRNLRKEVDDYLNGLRNDRDNFLGESLRLKCELKMKEICQ